MVLVYYNVPKGVLALGQKNPIRIYGAHTNHKPYDLDWDIYVQCKEALVEATYREDYLSKLCGKPVSSIAFRLSELKHYPDRTILRLAKELGIYWKGRTARQACNDICRFLKHGTTIF